MKLNKPEELRLGQAIYNMISEQLKSHCRKLLCENPIEYEAQVIDEKARLADYLHFIPDSLLIKLLDEYTRKSEANTDSGNNSESMNKNV